MTTGRLNPTILYIEDDAASRLLVERTLRHAGYTVLVAANGLEGIDIARRENPDLILTDINLPDLSGREITTTLRADPRFQHKPIVALTAQAYREQRELTMAAGVTGYLTKPLDVEALPTQIEFYLHGGRDKIETGELRNAQTRYTQEVVGRLELRIRELETLNSALRRLDRMKDTFIQLTAHELRTPLTLVYGYTRLLEDNPNIGRVMNDDETVRMLVSSLNDATRRMQGIINEIITMSRIMTNQIDLAIAPVHLASLVQKAVQTYQQAIAFRKLNVDIVRDGFPADQVQIDADLMLLALTNLVSNAIKYTPDGGTITIAARKSDGDHITLTIRDTGIGIAPTEQGSLFERFHTTSDTELHSTSKTAFRGGGIGLGLAMAKGIIDAHGGTIALHSPGFDPDKLPGTEVVVVLPLVVTQTRRKRVGG